MPSAAACPVLIKKMQVPQKDKTGLLAGGASAPYDRFAAGKASAQAGFISAEHLKHRRVEQANGPAEPKTKGTTGVVPFVLEHRNTIDAAQYVKGLFFSQLHGMLYPQVCVSFCQAVTFFFGHYAIWK